MEDGHDSAVGSEVSELLDPSLNPGSLLPFIWLAEDPESLDLLRDVLESKAGMTGEKRSLIRKIQAKQDEVMPAGTIRELRGPAFLIKEARNTILSGSEARLDAFIASRSSGASSDDLAKRILNQELMRHQFGDAIFHKGSINPGSSCSRWSSNRVRAQQAVCLSEGEEAFILGVVNRGKLVYVFPAANVFCALWKLDDSAIGVSATYTGNTQTGFLATHWISFDGLTLLPRILCSLWPCFGEAADFEYIDQDEAEIRLGLADLPRESTNNEIRTLLGKVRDDWMRREYKIFSMRTYSQSMIPVALKNGDLSISWLTGSTRSEASESAYHDPLVRSASTPRLRSEVASAWANALLSTPSFALALEKSWQSAYSMWVKLEQLEWMFGRPGSLREHVKGWFALPEEIASGMGASGHSYGEENRPVEYREHDWSHNSRPSRRDGMAELNPVAYARKLIGNEEMSDSEIKEIIYSGSLSEYGISPSLAEEYESRKEQAE